MKNLATIQTIKTIRSHPNADALELADVLGWQVVVKKGEFKTNDLCVYVVIDTVLPEVDQFEFLRNKHFRIKPIRLRGQYSNGICFPLSILPSEFKTIDIGEDVTDILNIKKYEKPIPAQLAGEMYGHLPSYIRMTDEDNLRSYPNALNELIGKEYYITIKDDGSSGTYFIKDNKFGVCSRRIHLKENENNGFWKMEYKYNIQAALRTYFPDFNIALQGEVVGPGIQGNQLGLNELEFHVFNLFDIQNRTYLSYEILLDFSRKFNIPIVSLVETGLSFNYSINELVELANRQLYSNSKPAEGIVIRPKNTFYSVELQKDWSGKIINEKYNEV